MPGTQTPDGFNVDFSRGNPYQIEQVLTLKTILLGPKPQDVEYTRP